MKTIKLKVKTRTLTCWMTRDNIAFANVDLWKRKPHGDMRWVDEFWREEDGVLLFQFSPEEWVRRYGDLPPRGSRQKVRIQVLP